jgi:hypothetical protein
VGTGIAKVIAGIDLASLDERTAICRIAWRDGRVTADDPVLGQVIPNYAN